MKKKAIILSLSQLHNGPRYIREFEMLKNDFEIYAIGITHPSQLYIKYIDYYREIRNNIFDKVFDKVKLFWGFNNIYRLSFFAKRKLITKIVEIEPELVIIHTPVFLPFVFDNFPNRTFRVVFNAHEYHPLEFEDNTVWLNSYGKFYTKLYRNYLQQLDLLVNVSDGIAEKCLAEFGKESIVIPNVAEYNEIKPIINKGYPIKIIHHGACIRARGIELMIRNIARFPNKFTLDLMLTNVDNEYFEEIKLFVKDKQNINLIPPVQYSDIIKTINRYDIGLFFLEGINFNYKYALPNKFFEYIQAKLAIIIGPSIEMKKFVDKYQIGFVSKSLSDIDIDEVLHAITRDEIEKIKYNTVVVAKELSFEKFSVQYLTEIKRILECVE